MACQSHFWAGISSAINMGTVRKKETVLQARINESKVVTKRHRCCLCSRSHEQHSSPRSSTITSFLCTCQAIHNVSTFFFFCCYVPKPGLVVRAMQSSDDLVTIAGTGIRRLSPTWNCTLPGSCYRGLSRVAFKFLRVISAVATMASSAGRVTRWLFVTVERGRPRPSFLASLW